MHELLISAARKVRSTGAEDIAARWELGKQLDLVLTSGEFGITDVERLLDEAGHSFPRMALRAMQKLSRCTEDELNWLIKDAEGKDSPWEHFYSAYREASKPARRTSTRSSQLNATETLVAYAQAELGYADRADARELVQSYMINTGCFRKFVESVEAQVDELDERVTECHSKTGRP